MFSTPKEITRSMTLLACSFAVALCVMPSQSNADPRDRIKSTDLSKLRKDQNKAKNRNKIMDLIKKDGVYVFPKTNVQIERIGGDKPEWGATKTVKAAALKYQRFQWSTKETNIAKGQWWLFSNKPVSLTNLVNLEQVPAPAPGQKASFNLDLHSVIAAKNNGSVPVGTYYLAIFPQNAQNMYVGKLSNLVAITVTTSGPATNFDEIP
ncbi:MAG: hypothetical protein O3C40_03290 [Planctomycetota bacterium]|nr:hypothetical protein [Planctomycetota bacterium]